jgi:glycosyltransferase involved in cell wall biosynthesis
VLPVLIGFPFGSRIGGAEEVLWGMLRGRAEVGIDPHVLFLADGDFRAEVEAEGIPTSVIEPGRFREPWRLAGAIGRTARLINRLQPRLCISWLPRVQTVLGPAAAITGRAGHVVYFECEVPRGLINHAAVALPCRWVVACSTSALAANQAMAPHRDGTTVWPGIDPPEHTAPARLAQMRSELGLGERPVIGVVGRLLSWKGQDKLIEAAALLRAEGLEVDVLIVGSEAHGVEPGIEQRLRALAADLGLQDSVVFTGHVPDAAPYMELMDVFVSASDGEPFGVVLLEAMALGKPVVAVAKHGPLDIIEHGESGLLAPTNAPGDLATAIAALLNDERGRAWLATCGQNRYRAMFRRERMLADLRRTLHGFAAEIDGVPAS